MQQKSCLTLNQEITAEYDNARSDEPVNDLHDYIYI